MAEADIRASRLKKLELLSAEGMPAYPAESRRTHTIVDALTRFDTLAAEGTEITLAGRILSLRDSGSIVFADLCDGSASFDAAGSDRMQVVLQRDKMDDKAYTLFIASCDVGDFVEITGTCFKTKRETRSLQASSWRMLSKSLTPIPDAWFGLKDEELKARLRTIDLLLDQELRQVFIRKAKFWHAIRQFLLQRGFLEVETPALETSPGGADARPFVTHHNALDIDVFLRISAGELWQKRLLIAGFPKVFEIGRIFRNEGQSREHLQDYTQLETYEAYSSMKEGGDFVKELYRHVAKDVYGTYTFEIGEHTVDLAAEWEVIDFCSAIKKEYGIDPLAATEDEAIRALRDAHFDAGEKLNKARAIDHLWKKLRKTIAGPAFLVGVPVFLEPLAKRYDKNPEIVERLQVILAGSEIGKGFSELNDPTDQRARFEEQQKQREAGDEEAHRLDEDYIRDMEFGMPPAFGFGVSERLFSFLENRSVHDTQLFPLLRPKQ